MRCLLVDNYDSFTFNLFQLLARLVARVEVVRNDATSVDDVARARPAFVVLSPGPRDPASAGISLGLVARLAGEIPVFGVCLGHQCINEAFGGRTVPAPRPRHGVTSRIRADGRGVFSGLPRELDVMRYHSLTVDPRRVGRDLVVTAVADDGAIMGLRHARKPIEGVQFHPESFLTEHGLEMIRNFVSIYAGRA